MDYRIFTLNQNYCIIHYPEKPNGFGILLLGDEENFVVRSGSLWLRNNSRQEILQLLIDHGYTIFYSNLGGKHMGNQDAIEQAKDLYEYVKRTEILNDKIHIIAEGFGATVVRSLIETKNEMIRSILFINPIFSLKWMYEMVKVQPFSYKKFLSDIKKAYKISDDDCIALINTDQFNKLEIRNEYKVIHILEHGHDDNEWIKWYQMYLDHSFGEVHILLPDKRADIFKYAIQLFKKTEQKL